MIERLPYAAVIVPKAQHNLTVHQKLGRLSFGGGLLLAWWTSLSRGCSSGRQNHTSCPLHSKCLQLHGTFHPYGKAFNASLFIRLACFDFG
jgi:hypothetical protein